MGDNNNDRHVSEIWATRSYFAGNITRNVETVDNIKFSMKKETTAFLSDNGTCEIDLTSVFGLDWS